MSSQPPSARGRGNRGNFVLTSRGVSSRGTLRGGSRGSERRGRGGLRESSAGIYTDMAATVAEEPKVCFECMAVFVDGAENKEPYLSEPSNLVTFLVGQTKQKFIIHKEFVCRHSPVLGAAFNGSFVEGTTKVYTLEDVDPEEFRLFSQYLYARKIDFKDSTTGDVNHTGKDNEPERFAHNLYYSAMLLTLSKLWVLAGRFLVIPLQNLVVYHMSMIQSHSGVLNGQHFKYIYENTPSDSPLRKLVANQCAWDSAWDFFATSGADLPHEMLIDIATLHRIYTIGGGFRPAKMTVENYFISQ
ncbi:hypothetical protein VTL71DRAFT_12083 [Oculimacula yallundae]|uniref:BTB domain-containing protein n=1 Tax=Oculimacula yallundae TaxID=86028 RepID=A0ABR4CS16_9HELO